MKITTASVRVMRSYDYNHFEVNLTASDISTKAEVNELRKMAQRLADTAVEQFKTAIKAHAKRESMENKYFLDRAMRTPEDQRTPEEKAVIKYHSDAAFAARFNYDYEDDWQEDSNFED